MSTAWLQALARRVSIRSREGRYRRLRAMIESLPRAEGRVRRVIDLGGRTAYWRAFGLDQLRRLDVQVTVVNLERERIAAAEADCLGFLEGDACALPQLADGTFDLAHSNSVIEHVGGRARRQAFADEVRRLGRAYFVETPYFWFPVEPHFLSLGFHWLPEAMRVRRLMRRDMGHHHREPTPDAARATVRSARLLTGRGLRELFPDARVIDERMFGLIKSLIAVRGA